MDPIKCYLCNGDAEYKGAGDGGLLINCPHCKYYWATVRAIRFYLKREAEPLLDSEDFEKLIKYVQDNYSEVDEVAVKLDTKTIVSVTRKRSVHYR